MGYNNNFRCIFFVFTLFVLCLFFQTENSYASAYAYIANGADDTASVIQVKESSVIDTIPVGNNPYGVAVDPDGDYFFVSNFSDGTVSVVDPSLQSAIKTFSVGSSPMGIDVSSDGTYLYVANNNDNTVSIIDIWNDETSTVTVGNEPTGVAAVPDGGYVYVTNYLDNTVSVISDETNTVITTITNDISDDETVFDGPFGIVSSSDGDSIYVVDNISAKLVIIDAEDFNDDESDEHEFESSVGVGNDPRGVCLATVDGDDYAYVSNYEDNTISIIELSDLSVEEIPVGNGPFGISATPDGSYVFVVNTMDSTVSVIDLEDKAVTDTIAVGDSPVSFGNFVGGKLPTTPSDVTATLQGDNVIKLTWNDESDDELGFKIKRKKYSSGSYALIKTLDADETSYQDGGLDGNATYHYKICAYNYMGDSDYSDDVEATTNKIDDGGGCFIATATYGSPMEPKVGLLREFRDRFPPTTLLIGTLLFLLSVTAVLLFIRNGDQSENRKSD